MLMQAQNRIQQQVGHIVSISPMYITAAWGLTDQPDFMNQCLVIETPFPPQLCMLKLLHIEKQMGRKREIKWGPRTIDIDILFFDHLKLKSTLLEVPHPFLHERRFVLEPLTSIAPNYIHPTFGKSLKSLLVNCTDYSPIKKK